MRVHIHGCAIIVGLSLAVPSLSRAQGLTSAASDTAQTDSLARIVGSELRDRGVFVTPAATDSLADLIESRQSGDSSAQQSEPQKIREELYVLNAAVIFARADAYQNRYSTPEINLQTFEDLRGCLDSYPNPPPKCPPIPPPPPRPQPRP